MSKKSANNRTKKLSITITRDQYGWLKAYNITDYDEFFRMILGSYISAYGEAERKLMEEPRVIVNTSRLK